MLHLLENDTVLPIKQLKVLASKRSAGKQVEFRGTSVTVEEALPESFKGVDIALFSAGGAVSKELAPEAAKHGAIVIDNTSAFRMDPEVPLVVPEVNEQALFDHNGIIANPNCSTIQMVAALQPLREKFGLSRIIVSTYQAVSGAGMTAIEEMKRESQAALNGEPVNPSFLPVKSGEKHYQIAFNAIPQIDKFQDNRYTFEEMKMINETRKIMGDASIKVAATCVRLPVHSGHAESVYVELGKADLSVEEILNVLSEAPGVIVEDDPATQTYPMPINSVGKTDVFVGRVRRDLDVASGYHLWIVSDNLLKGAAWNSIQIAHSLIKLGLIKTNG
ncbi:aspartate-semialdehyde dehydrogenase [Pullulanibacillus sp. KACC 23026]|uniref:aspartate-semialdehyde dehydrogenase n=1 Tax=Pullulanibacillus sp. KACC 23026 TaxID=3028315 RepID=UPI0023B2050C|nr:aspartate-semialdehyde dehydrogenase [Pullulanibacillus sp. KACC 23026]WEG14992.1 aspartate-semialdehyde dehydrogenase [Pullulanibacillus sp. KACC 23026]